MKTRFGGVAQLGERYTGSVEVMGSNPTVSTILKALKHYVSGLFLCPYLLRLGGWIFIADYRYAYIRKRIIAFSLLPLAFDAFFVHLPCIVPMYAVL